MTEDQPTQTSNAPPQYTNGKPTTKEWSKHREPSWCCEMREQRPVTRNCDEAAILLSFAKFVRTSNTVDNLRIFYFIFSSCFGLGVPLLIFDSSLTIAHAVLPYYTKALTFHSSFSNRQAFQRWWCIVSKAWLV